MKNVICYVCVNIKTIIIPSMFFVIIQDVFDMFIGKAPAVTTTSRKTTVFRDFEKGYKTDEVGWDNI